MEIFLRGKKFKAEIRKASDLIPVLAFPEALKEDFNAYYMFRNIYFDDEQLSKLKETGLRYDYTIMISAEVGGERIKTLGHYHPEVFEGLTYPEVYQVLKGRAFFLLQKEVEGKIVDAVVVEAEKKDIVIVPPNYGHVTINPEDEKIVTANWVCNKFSPIYEPYKMRRGACYYYVNEEWIKNPRYGKVPELRFAEPNSFFDLEDMFELIDDVEKLSFLTKPQEKINIIKKIRI
ncbi:MAG: glucose-6-phosphate isomerase [Archaeoglobaceae archaeon]|nr:glucose-6-phosphate isomerase [Archaeoglobaceae archaeon]MCX8152178.1 glucose-6-phosphate isomerase [Archaeoglobaceae archaeon]MDW8013894.1 glucose-6-phosphate isomerase family protein [Archaeoglobaceae archaeon]